MKYSKKESKIARKIILNSLRNGEIDEKSLLSSVSKVRRIGAKQARRLLSALIAQVRSFYKSRTLLVESGRNLNPEYLEEIRKIYEVKTNKDLRIVFRENPLLIGGIRVKLGDMVWDYSIEQTLNSFKEAAYG